MHIHKKKCKNKTFNCMNYFNLCIQISSFKPATERVTANDKIQTGK